MRPTLRGNGGLEGSLCPQGLSAQIPLLTHAPPDRSHRVKGSLGGLITSFQSRQAGLWEEGRAWGLGCACAEPCPSQSCLWQPQPVSRPGTPPGLRLSSLRDLCPREAFLGAGAAPLVLGLTATTRKGLEQGEGAQWLCHLSLPSP